jgi:GTP-binding protein HflX
VHTHLRGEDLTRDDLTDLALLRLDLMAAIDVDTRTGLPGVVRAAHMLPSAPLSDGNGNGDQFAFLAPAVPSQLQVDFLALMEALEAEMARNRRTVKRTGAGEAAILLHVTTGSISEAEDSMAELRELALSAGVAVVDEIIQRRSAIDPRTVMGKGKLDELLIRAMQIGADALIFDRELQPAQVRSISDATDLKVVDRSQLILDIFAQRAQSREGKIQVELAQLKYMLPRLVIGQDSAGRGKQNWKPIAAECAIASIASKRNSRLNAVIVSNGAKSVCVITCPSFRLSATPTRANQHS